MAKNTKKIIFQHILEIRLKSLNVAFIDYRGIIAEKLISNLGTVDKFRITGDRVDLLTKDNKINYFITISNLGFQIENTSSFNDFRNYSKLFLESIEKIAEYQPKDFVRIGTKTQLLVHEKGQGFDQAKDYFNKKLISMASLEKSLNGNLIDIGFPLNFESKEGCFNIITGPMKKTQALEQFFQKRGVDYENSLPDNGLFFSIDFFNLNPKFKKLNEAIVQVLKNINLIESKFKQFEKWITNG